MGSYGDRKIVEQMSPGPANNTSAYVNGTWASSGDHAALLLRTLGERRKGVTTVILLTIIYTAIFITGVLGNLSTCIVIWRNSYMHSVTNYYLFNLAVSDVLTLFIALPPEVYSIWEAYPWRFGEPFCIIKTFVMEMTSYSSVLTITGFTIERYMAICHPIKLQPCCHVSRATRCIIIIWTISTFSALPYPVHSRTFYYLSDPQTGRPIADSLVCNIPHRWTGRMISVFQLSTFVYFLVPMVVITLIYVLIGVRLRATELTVPASPQYGKTTATRARRAILRMLVAVVVAFFLCWAPFHAQRLMTLYVEHWTSKLIEVQGYLFYVSGILYFFSSTVNPILYNLLSRKFRRAFKRTLCRCFVSANSLPTFYMLKAKFINNDGEAGSSRGPSISRPAQQKHRLRLVSYYKNEKHAPRCRRTPEKPSTRDTLLNKTTRSSTCSSHAHSDGGLHALCRHKRCTSRRKSSLTPRLNGLVASFQDIKTLRRKDVTASPSRLNAYIPDDKDDTYECESTTDAPILRITLRV
ncbi:PK1R-like protein [Mya arenaria]|uniref:PK1R-like protein n=1 Tax=Mya arenaria TaxID=6604 RepID=A0ABY7EQE6_MYAAR|nr:pyrokinin-1 receptor-like isoform X2 [Mya arenaria]WAR09401.1 PK1R-like protein [Mya arenaria]